MKFTQRSICGILIFAAGVFSILQSVQAAPFTYAGRDLLLTFRKTGANQGTSELLVNLGQATNFSTLAQGTVITISNFNYLQLTNAFGDLNDLSFSAGACVKFADIAPGYPNNTLWVTNPRVTNSVQSTPYVRVSSGSAQNVTGKIASMGNNGVSYSGQNTSNQFNTAFAVQIPAGSPIAPSVNLGVLGDYGGSFGSDTEKTTPDIFASPVRSDLYELVPTGNVDAHTGMTNGDGAYLGYFELKPNGTLTFTAGTGAAVVIPPPALTFVRSNTVTWISLTTTNNATYTLHYTNSAGLTTSVTNWPVLNTNLSGDGSIQSFQDTSTDPNRFYSVEAH
ncbi:MAG: hypothetical protein JWR19_4429 [Pedosphaera sp.]|nr:hypothetical protein [Pedosphaera sp.]